jgi:hypothetical protein
MKIILTASVALAVVPGIILLLAGSEREKLMRSNELRPRNILNRVNISNEIHCHQ